MSLFSALADLIKPAPPPDPEVAAALDRVIGMVDPLVRAAPQLEKHLLGAVEHALAYCAGLVDALPGPVDINRQAFAQDPLVHALFATAEDIDGMLGHSTAIRDYLARPECWDSDHFCAMLAARRQQKRQFGMARHGDFIQADVPQEILYFSNQTLVEPCCDVDRTRTRLRARALESLLRTFNTRVEALRLERDAIRADLKAEYAWQQGSPHGTEAQQALHSRHLVELDSKLRALGDAMLPEHLAEALADFLHHPECALQLRAVHMRIDRLGVVLPDDEVDLSAQILDFPELSSRDRRLHMATLVRVARCDALAAVDRVKSQQNRTILI